MTKLGAAVTVRVTVVMRWMPPDAGHGDGIGSGQRAVADCDGHGRAARTRRGNGLRIEGYLTPEGTPEADRLIALLKPSLIVLVMVVVPWGRLHDH